MKRILARAVFWAGLPGLAWAGGKGTAAMDFLTPEAGARALAMGEAFTAAARDADALAWNPAALTRVPHRSLTLMHASVLEGATRQRGAFAQKVGRGAWGFGVDRRTYGDVVMRDAAGAETGRLTPSDLLISAGGAARVGPVSIGFAGKLARSSLLDAAQTLAADAGVLSQPLWGRNVRLGLAALNVGGKPSYGKSAEALPTAVKAGAAFTPSRSLTLALDAARPRSGNLYAAFGAEYALVVGKTSSWALRAGYNTRDAGEGNGGAGASFGLGFGWSGMAVDYALVPLGDLGLTHRVSLAYEF